MNKPINPIGTIYNTKMPTVFISAGNRGKEGLGGEKGDQGDTGDSINVRGQWQSGFTYAPLDAVNWRSSALTGVTSLYIQNSTAPSEVSTIEPQDDPARWSEIGLTTNEGLLGGVWVVSQPSHPFSKVGQPAAYTGTGYQLANAAVPNLFGVAMVREIIDQDTFILQSTGGIKDVDPTVSLSGSFIDGTIYYVSTQAGFLTSTRPSAANQLANAIYLAGPDGVVLPWIPALNEDVILGVPMSRTRYYYTATGGQTVFTGADDNGNTPDYSGGTDTVDAFLIGLNLVEDVDYTIDSGSTLTLTTGSPSIGFLEVWVSEIVPAASTARSKMDAIIFDGVSTVYPLQQSSAPVPFDVAAAFDVYIDGNPQEPDVDFFTVDNGGNADVSFAIAPEAQSNNWIIKNTG